MIENKTCLIVVKSGGQAYRNNKEESNENNGPVRNGNNEELGQRLQDRGNDILLK